MTEFKRQFDQKSYPPIVITILKHSSNMVVMRQGNNKIYIERDSIEAFAVEMNEVKRWSLA